MREKAMSKEEFSKTYKENLIDIIDGVSDREVSNFINILLTAREKKSTIYFIGNGGSASTASHFVNDLSIGTKSLVKPFRAVSLCDNHAVMTAIANDYGYEEVFSRQLDVLLKKDDVVVAISASGNSSNLINALNLAKDKMAVTVGLSAFDGGMLKKLADISVHVPTQKGAYGPAEDVHMMLDHLVTGYLTSVVAQEKRNKDGE